MSPTESSVPKARLQRPSFTTRLRTINSRNRRADARVAEVVSVASGALLFATIGLALVWQPQVIVLGAVSFGLATWLARSLVRALMALVATFGLLGAGMTLLLAVSTELPATLHLQWTWFAYAWWGAFVLVAAGFRVAKVEPEFGLAELVGCWFAILSALRMSRRISYDNDLLTLLVHVEDNQAWVGLTTRVSAEKVMGTAFDYLGPVMPLMLGLLHEFQRSWPSEHNSTFSAYALAILITPLAAVGLYRRVAAHGAWVKVAFTGLLILWAYEVPLLLFASYGHLSAIWAFIFLLIGVSYLVFERTSSWASVVGAGLCLAFGSVWFPLIPLAAAVLVVVFVLGWHSRGIRGNVGIGLVVLLGITSLYEQLTAVIGAGAGDGFRGVETALLPLYAAKGGTAAIDSVLLALAVLGVVAVSFLLKRSEVFVAGYWKAGLALIAYVTAVFGGSYYLKVEIGYGPTKIAFICGFVVVMALIAIVMRLAMPQKSVLAVFMALALGSFIYGGAGAILARSWPGPGSTPIWLSPIEKVASGQATPKPIGCFSNQSFDAYMCTRWAGGLTPSGDGAFLDYRLNVINEIDPSASIDAMIKAGTLKESDLIVLEEPDAAHAWGWRLIRDAGTVFRADGTRWPDPPSGPATGS